MLGLEVWLRDLISREQSHILVSDPDSVLLPNGGLFLESTVPSSFMHSISLSSSYTGVSSSFVFSSIHRRKQVVLGVCWQERNVSGVFGGGFLSVSLRNDGFSQEATGCFVQNGDKASEEAARLSGGIAIVETGEKQDEVRAGGRAAMNTTKHLWAGAAAAMVSRYAFFFLWHFLSLRR